MVMKRQHNFTVGKLLGILLKKMVAVWGYQFCFCKITTFVEGVLHMFTKKELLKISYIKEGCVWGLTLPMGKVPSSCNCNWTFQNSITWFVSVLCLSSLFTNKNHHWSHHTPCNLHISCFSYWFLSGVCTRQGINGVMGYCGVISFCPFICVIII